MTDTAVPAAEHTPPRTAALEHQRATGALAVQAEQDTWTPAQRAALAQLGLADAGDDDLAVFLTYAQRTGLDPWARQIYMVARWDGRERRNKYTIQAGIDGLRIVAQRTRDYAGQVGPEWCGRDGAWRDVWLESEPPSAARVGVLRRGWAQPQYAVAIFREYAGTDKEGNPTKMWREKPALMIAKCAEALALRKAFPQDLSGVYTADEMSRAGDVVTGDVVTPAAAPPQQRAAAPAPPPLDIDALREAILTATWRGELAERMVDLGVAQHTGEGKVGWDRDRLSSVTLADRDGTEVTAWTLIGATAAHLPTEAPDPSVLDADVVDETEPAGWEPQA